MKKDKFFLDCCEKCGGKCCRVGGLYITKQEYKTLSIKQRVGFKKHYFGYNTYLGKHCPFLIESGCALGKDRFLECKLYPLEIRGLEKLVLKKECPSRELFNSEIFLKKGLQLLIEYQAKGFFNENDVISILNNVYPDKL